jgi:hypothetical protein
MKAFGSAAEMMASAGMDEIEATPYACSRARAASLFYRARTWFGNNALA